jgi:hypothetical protein
MNAMTEKAEKRERNAHRRQVGTHGGMDATRPTLRNQYDSRAVGFEDSRGLFPGHRLLTSFETTAKR